MKNVLWLGPSSPVGYILNRHGLTVSQCESPITLAFVRKGFDLAVSYRYRHIVASNIIDVFEGNILNLHIALLPWNRGADPNLWSFLEDTPKGATLHWMDAGLDTGDILAQQKIDFNPGETLSTTYRALERIALDLLDSFLPDITAGKAPRRPQPAGGSSHRTADKMPFMHLLADLGWDTPVDSLIGKGLK